MSTKNLVVAYAAAARTASPADVIIDTSQHSGCIIFIDVTAITATPSVTFNIKGRDPYTGTEYAILSSAAVVAVGDTILEIFPGTEEAANISENAYLPMEIVIDPVHGDADSITYAVSVHLLP